MGKFCTKCGKPVAEGQVCDCQLPQEVTPSMDQQAPSNYQQTPPNYQQTQPNYQQAQPNYQQAPPNYQQAPPNYQQAPPNYQQSYQNQQPYQGNGQQYQQFDMAKQKSSMFLKKVFIAFKNILRFPATEGAQFAVSQDTTTALGLIGFQAIFTTLFAFIVSAKIGTLFSSVSSYYSGDLSEAYKMPYFRIFIVTVLASVALSCILAGILLGICVLSKNNVTYKAMLCVVAVRSVVLIPVTLVACILFLFSPGYGIVLFYTGNLAGLCYMVSVFPVTMQENRNKVPMIVFFATIIFAAISMFLIKEFAPYYFPDVIKEEVLELKSALGNPAKLIESMFGEMN